MRSDAERLRDVLQAIEAIEQYRDRDKASFEQDPMLQVWFIHHLQIIGEAVRALSQEVRNLAPDIPWTKIIGMRNILVHGYFEVDTEIVWEAVTKDLPPLKTAIEKLLRQVEASE